MEKDKEEKEESKMKKILIPLLLCLQIFTLIGCSNKNTFTESSHPRSEFYNAVFDTMCKTEGNLTVHIAEGIYEEETAEEVFQQVKEDYDKLIEVTGQKENPVTVYIVSKTIVGKVYCAENEIYCTPSDLETEDFRTYLVKETLNLTDMWQCVGLSDFIFENKSKTLDTDELKEYYSKQENINTLSMFPAYFIENFNDDATLKIAKDTACQLTKFIIEKDGMEKYLSSANDDEYRNLWLESLGVKEKIPWEEDQLKYLKNIEFEMSEQYPLILSREHWNYYFNTTEWLQNSDEMFQFWMKANAGYDYLLECFNEYQLLDNEIIQSKMQEEKQIYLQDFNEVYKDNRDGYVIGNEVYIQNVSPIWHEMVHVFIPNTSEEEKIWLSEGVAEYFGLKVQDKYEQSISKDRAFIFLTYEIQEDDIGDAFTFQKMAIDYYKKYSGLPADENDISEALLIKSIAVTAILHPELDSDIYMIKTSVAETGLRENRVEKSGGNALSYAEASVFVEYLADTYGMDTVVSSVCEVGDLEKYYGKDYEALYQDLINYLQE